MADVTYREITPQDSFSITGSVTVDSITDPVVVASITDPIAVSSIVADVSVAPVDTYEYRVARGAAAGVAALHKFGRNPEIDLLTDPEDIWDAGGLYSFPTSAIALELVSTSTSDDVAGTGAQQVTVYGLDTNWLEQSEVVDTDGTTAVALANTYRRVFRAIVTRMGTDSDEANIGDISIQAVGGATTYAEIISGNGQTGMAIYTIPAGKKGYLSSVYATVNPKTSANLDMQMRFRDTTGTNPVSAVKLFFGVSDSAPFLLNYRTPLQVSAQTDIIIRAVETSANDADVSAGFNLLLEDD